MRPIFLEDGGDLRYLNFSENDGIVYVDMIGSCAECPSASETLKNGVEGVLKHYVDEV